MKNRSRAWLIRALIPKPDKVSILSIYREKVCVCNTKVQEAECLVTLGAMEARK